MAQRRRPTKAKRRSISQIENPETDTPSIPAALITGIRSEVPGQITAQVTENVK